MDRQPFKTLARIVQTLAVGRAVELPFAPGERGMEWSETFEVGRDRVNGGEAVLHRISTRKNGNVREQLADATDWTLDDILQQVVEWDDLTFEHVERALMPLDDAGPTVEGIADLTDGPGVVMVSGRLWKRETDAVRLTTDGDAKWSLDEAVSAVKAGR